MKDIDFNNLCIMTLKDTMDIIGWIHCLLSHIDIYYQVAAFLLRQAILFQLQAKAKVYLLAPRILKTHTHIARRHGHV